jgi:hypothetical protein
MNTNRASTGLENGEVVVETRRVPEKARILRGPWSAPPAGLPASESVVSADGQSRMSLGFVVRQCAIEIGHAPTPRELADWANHQLDGRGEYRLFGRAISSAEAAVILRHPGREVTVRPERIRRS